MKKMYICKRCETKLEYLRNLANGIVYKCHKCNGVTFEFTNKDDNTSKKCLYTHFCEIHILETYDDFNSEWWIPHHFLSETIFNDKKTISTIQKNREEIVLTEFDSSEDLREFVQQIIDNHDLCLRYDAFYLTKIADKYGAKLPDKIRNIAIAETYDHYTRFIKDKKDDIRRCKKEIESLEEKIKKHEINRDRELKIITGNKQ